MFCIKHTEFYNKVIFDVNNCIFSAGVSRPSKSIINCELYKNYSRLNLDIFNEFSSINNKKNYYLLKEIISVFKLEVYDIDSLSISFDTIIVNEFEKENKNLIFCFDNDISLRNILCNFNEIIKELNKGDDLIINFHNLFIYPAVELLSIISSLFNKVKVYYCKLIKQNIIYCKNYCNESNESNESNKKNTLDFINKVLQNWNKNSHIRQFGIFINESLLNKIKIYNNFIFDYYIELNNNFSISTIEDKEYFLKNYIKKISNVSNVSSGSSGSSGSNVISLFNCNHDIVEFNLMKCYICKKCNDLFQIY